MECVLTPSTYYLALTPRLTPMSYQKLVGRFNKYFLSDQWLVIGDRE